MQTRRSWFRQSADDSLRLRENHRALVKARRVATAAVLVTLPLFIERWGWWIAAVAVAFLAYTSFLDRRYDGSSGELWILSGTLVTQAMFAAGAIETGGPTSPVLVWLLLAVAIAPARYSLRSTVIMLGFSLLALAAAALSAGLAAFLAHPELAAVTLSAAVGIAACGIAAQGSELTQRAAAITDPLTGLLNRTSLARSFEMLARTALETDQRVALITADLDHFKRINDEHGHGVGDEVLVATSACLRRVLPDGALSYRLGGEEFGILLLLSGGEDAAAHAEFVRAAIAASQPAGLLVTASVGSAVAARDASLEQVLSAADGALYQAKAAGRNCTRGATDPPAILRPVLSPLASEGDAPAPSVYGMRGR